MPAPPFNYVDFRGGFNTYNSYDQLADDEARDLSNVQGTTAGAIVKRGGFQLYATLASTVASVHAPSDSSLLIAADNTGKLISVTGGGATLTTLKTGLAVGVPWQWVRGPAIGAQGPSYGMDGDAADTPQQWNEVAGTTTNWTATDAGGAVPNGKFCMLFQNQVYVAGTVSNPSRLYWSGIADPTAWNPANLNGSGFMDFDPNDGQAITGLGQVGPYVLVFKTRKTWVLVSAATATARKLSDQVGLTSSRSVASGAEGTYFLGDNRVYVTNGSKLTPVSDKITPTLQSFNPVCACYANQHYYLAGSDQGGASLVLDYDARLGSWWKHTMTGAYINSWTVPYVNGVGLVPFAAFGSKISKAFQSGVYQDNGANFTWSWSGPWQSPTFYRRRRFPTPFQRKRMRQIRYDGLGQVDLSLCKDFNTTPTAIASDIFGNSSITKEGRVYGQGVANAFSLVFSGTYPTTAQINQYTLLVSDRRDGLVS